MNNVRLLRDQRGMTQDEFADYCNISRMSIARYEAGELISSKSAEQIAKACNVTIDFVIGVPGAQDIHASPAIDEQLIEMLISLPQDQIQRVKDFVSGLKAARK